jgi:DNA (cytosine-5)-methyltransferase 1
MAFNLEFEYNLVLDLGFDLSEDVPPIENKKHPFHAISSHQIINQIYPNVRMFRMIELFSATGAFTKAFENTGKVTSIFSNHTYLSSKTVHDLNFKPALTLCQTKDLNVPRHHILTAAFPHDSFLKNDGMELLLKILEIIDENQTAMIVLEIEKNFLNHNVGNTFSAFKRELEKRKYYLCCNLLNAYHTGFPQFRERFYIVALKSRELFDKFDLDFPVVKRMRIHKFLEKNVHPRYYYTDKSNRLESLKKTVIRRDTFYQFNSGQTLIEEIGRKQDKIPVILDKRGIRRLTPRECFSIQGFSSTYKLPITMDSTLYELAGNSSSLSVIQRIADRLMNLC